MRASTLSFFLFFLSLCSSFAQLSQNQIKTVKADLVKAVESSKTTDSLYNRLEALPTKSAILTAYIGALQALKAKHAWNPYSKISNVNRSLKTLAKAVKMDRENLEIRFIRFSIEYNTPSFLGYGKNLEEDKMEILKHFKNENFKLAGEDLVKNIAKFMVESKRCTADEIKLLKRYI